MHKPVRLAVVLSDFPSTSKCVSRILLKREANADRALLRLDSCGGWFGGGRFLYLAVEKGVLIWVNCIFFILNTIEESCLFNIWTITPCPSCLDPYLYTEWVVCAILGRVSSYQVLLRPGCLPFLLDFNAYVEKGKLMKEQDQLWWSRILCRNIQKKWSVQLFQLQEFSQRQTKRRFKVPSKVSVPRRGIVISSVLR